MTFKKQNFIFWHTYTLLDDFADLKITSRRKLNPKDVDILTAKIMELKFKEGRLKTEKGTIKYKYNLKIWE